MQSARLLWEIIKFQSSGFLEFHFQMNTSIFWLPMRLTLWLQVMQMLVARSILNKPWKQTLWLWYQPSYLNYGALLYVVWPCGCCIGLWNIYIPNSKYISRLVKPAWLWESFPEVRNRKSNREWSTSRPICLCTAMLRFDKKVATTRRFPNTGIEIEVLCIELKITLKALIFWDHPLLGFLSWGHSGLVFFSRFGSFLSQLADELPHKTLCKWPACGLGAVAHGRLLCWQGFQRWWRAETQCGGRSGLWRTLQGRAGRIIYARLRSCFTNTRPQVQGTGSSSRL